VLCQIFSYDFPTIRNLPNIFLRSFENVAPNSYSNIVHNADNVSSISPHICWIHADTVRDSYTYRNSYDYVVWIWHKSRGQTLPLNIIDDYLGCFCSFRLRRIVTFT